MYAVQLIRHITQKFAATGFGKMSKQHSACYSKVPGFGQQKKLFTPGPLCVTASVKEAMLIDYGSRDKTFVDIVKNIRKKLLDIGEVESPQYAALPLQGSGTYSVEAVLTTTVPQFGAKVLVLENGAYGKRIEGICKLLGIDYDVIRFSESNTIDFNEVAQAISRTCYHTVCIVHCETSTGILNPIFEVGNIIKEKGGRSTRFFVDAMSSFGAIPINIQRNNIDYLVSSANKCLQGVPGFSFVICKTDHLLKCKGQSRSLSLDLVSQYESLESTGQFRFTPPTHSLLAFHQALVEFFDEGGVLGRLKRYEENTKILHDGMSSMGFKTLLTPDLLTPIITCYNYPKTPDFVFAEFYSKLSDLNQLIYPGKLTKTNCFRIGTIGDINAEDIVTLLRSIEKVCKDMGIILPLI